MSYVHTSLIKKNYYFIMRSRTKSGDSLSVSTGLMDAADLISRRAPQTPKSEKKNKMIPSSAASTGGGSVSSMRKIGRVKVGVRCRPPFQDEIDFAQGNFISIVSCTPETKTSLGRVSLTLASGKERDFVYDFVFEPGATQDQVYDRIARPVISDVLRGFNGTIFAYGQTGTGKTYTMGILEFVDNENAGIIPRALFQVFTYVKQKQAQTTTDITVTMSFLQVPLRFVRILLHFTMKQQK